MTKFEKLRQKVMGEIFDNSTDLNCSNDFRDGANWALTLVQQWIERMQKEDSKL